MSTGEKLELEIMRLGVDHKFPVKLGNYSILLRPLSCSEMVTAAANVAQHMATLPSTHRTDVMENTLRAKEFLKMASGEFGQPYGVLTDDNLDKMTNGQLMAIFKEWTAITDKTNPDIETLPSEVLKNVVDDLKNLKKNDPDAISSQLTELSFGQLRSLVHYLLTNGD